MNRYKHHKKMSTSNLNNIAQNTIICDTMTTNTLVTDQLNITNLLTNSLQVPINNPNTPVDQLSVNSDNVWQAAGNAASYFAGQTASAVRGYYYRIDSTVFFYGFAFFNPFTSSNVNSDFLTVYLDGVPFQNLINSSAPVSGVATVAPFILTSFSNVANSVYGSSFKMFVLGPTNQIYLQMLRFNPVNPAGPDSSNGYQVCFSISYTIA